MTFDAGAGAAIKLIVWDLDNTLWDGILMEGDSCVVFPDVADFIRDSDRKGILHSIASRNDPAAALAHLEGSGLGDLFLYPQIGWGAKSLSIVRIAEQLNIGLDSAVFIDDSDFELEEARSAAPELRVLNVARLAELRQSGLLDGLRVTGESERRRRLYQEDMKRRDAEQSFADTPQAFLATLALRMTLQRATHDDLDRAEELVQRTNQLNSTGRIFSSAELATMIDRGAPTLLVATLEDRFGHYGTVALIVLEQGPERWTVELILVSCRVMSRGIGPLLLDYLAHQAEKAGKALAVEFRDTGRNQAMKIALMMTGFLVGGGAPPSPVQRGRGARPLPSWLHVTSGW
ncbi:MAG TPA: HAD-IIIC family phosphatase [Allosphingosinicella sp.]|nr:HAD-IIIC family phosphatase [Allosphingosinicella sp.]